MIIERYNYNQNKSINVNLCGNAEHAIAFINFTDGTHIRVLSTADTLIRKKFMDYIDNKELIDYENSFMVFPSSYSHLFNEYEPAIYNQIIVGIK